jgi:uncharacterized membrane protein
MTEAQRRGRRIVRLHICIMLVVSVIGIVGAWSVANDPTRFPKSIVRSIITVVLCWWMYSGNRLARWIMIVLLCLGGASAFALSLRDELFAQIMGFALAVFYMAFAWLLLWSDTVNQFLAYQRGERPPD